MANTLFNSDVSQSLCHRCRHPDLLEMCYQQFTIIQGEDTIRGYDDTADSGETITRHFCSNCGSSLFNTNKKNPQFAGLVVVATGTIEDDFDWGEFHQSDSVDSKSDGSAAHYSPNERSILRTKAQILV